MEIQAHFDNLLQKFGKIISAGRLAHAYFIVGDDMEVLKQFVDQFLQLALCNSPMVEQGKACGECENCRRFQTYPFLYELKPASKSRKILVENVRRDFEDKFHVKAEAGQLRVGVIWEADCLVIEAQNSFLKTLEEPTPHSLMLLVSTHPTKLLPTIRSRCQLIALRTGATFDFNDLGRLLGALRDLNPAKGAEAALTASTVLGDCLANLRAEAEERVELPSATENETAGEKKKRLDMNKALIESEYLTMRQQLLGVIHTWFAQVLLLANGVSTEQLANKEFFEGGLPEWWQGISPERAEKLLLVTEEFLDNLRFNVKESLLIDDFFLKVCRK